MTATRKKQVLVRMTEDEYRIVRRLAADWHRSMNGVICTLIRREGATLAPETSNGRTRTESQLSEPVRGQTPLDIEE